MVKHPEISKSRKPYPLQGRKAREMVFVSRAYWELESWRPQLDRMLLARDEERKRGRSEKSADKQVLLSLVSNPTRSRLSMSMGSLLVRYRTGQRKEAEEDKCRIYSTVTITNIYLLVRCIVYMWVRSGYYNHLCLVSSFCCNSQIFSNVTPGKWSPWSKC